MSVDVYNNVLLRIGKYEVAQRFRSRPLKKYHNFKRLIIMLARKITALDFYNL